MYSGNKFEALDCVWRRSKGDWSLIRIEMGSVKIPMA
jgi:hypothetical protein